MNWKNANITEMNPKRLLLAEDDQMLASLLKYRLEVGGYQVDLALDGRAVKSYLKGGIPDLVVSDILMPYYSGIELVNFLRDELKSRVPVIMISKADTGSDPQYLYELGADVFIPKPVSPGYLLQKVDELMKRMKS